VSLQKSASVRFVIMILIMALVYLLLRPLEGHLVEPTIKLSSWISGLIFERVHVAGNCIFIEDVRVEVIEACTPTIFWALLFAYVVLDWNGKRSIATLLIGIPAVFFINALRIPFIVLLFNLGMSFQTAHELAEYALFLPTMFLLVILNTKIQNRS